MRTRFFRTGENHGSIDLDENGFYQDDKCISIIILVRALIVMGTYL